MSLLSNIREALHIPHHQTENEKRQINITIQKVGNLAEFVPTLPISRKIEVENITVYDNNLSLTIFFPGLFNSPISVYSDMRSFNDFIEIYIVREGQPNEAQIKNVRELLIPFTPELYNKTMQFRVKDENGIHTQAEYRKTV